MLNPLFFAGNSPKNFHEIYAEKTFSTKAWLPTMMIFEIITLNRNGRELYNMYFFHHFKKYLTQPKLSWVGADNITNDDPIITTLASAAAEIIIFPREIACRRLSA